MPKNQQVKIATWRKILLFVISVAMVVVGLLLLAFGLLAAMPRGGLLFVAGGATLAFIGLYLLWEDFIAPMFARR
jgi:predicted tellurium resistance membrane protein TerC